MKDLSGEGSGYKASNPAMISEEESALTNRQLIGSPKIVREKVEILNQAEINISSSINGIISMKVPLEDQKPDAVGSFNNSLPAQWLNMPSVVSSKSNAI